MRISRSTIIFLALLSVSLSLFPVTSPAQTTAARARVVQPVDMHDLVTLRGNVHPLARTEFDQGAAPDDLPMERILMVLQRGSDQEVALRKLLDEQQVKSSPQFHQWLTPEQFGRQFGPADSDLHAVAGWLAAQGFEVTNVAAGRTAIEFSGTAGLVRQVLGTEIHKFRVNGQDYWANATDPEIPAALAPVVAGFASLNNFPRRTLNQNRGTFRRSKATGKVEPLFTVGPVQCSDGSDDCYYFALGPTDFATIYNILPLWNAATPIDGTGQTIAVVGETDINPQDVADFRNIFGLPATNQPNIIYNGPDPGILTDGEETEADLDVEWSGAVGKGATVDFVVSESTETTAGIDLSALYIIDNNLASVMSESYGGCEAALGTGGNQFYNALWEQGSAQGITVLMAAGDSGPAGCDSANAGEIAAQYGLAVSGQASTPFNVAVGGTNFNFTSTNFSTYWSMTNAANTFSSALGYIPEITWENYCSPGASCPPTSYNSSMLDAGEYLYAGSGGPSSCITPTYTSTYPGFTCSGGYAKPTWQMGTGVPSDGARDIPDLSLFAGGNSFYVICEMDANAAAGGSSTSCDLNSPFTDFQGGGGTSAAVQAFAGIMAMVDQVNGRQGNANYVLYPMAAASGASCNSSTASLKSSTCIFYDVTSGTNTVICMGGSLNCSNTNTASGQYGAMEYGSSNAIAYPTTTGYDLATGLGTVNVANLVNNWKSTFTTTTTSLTLTPTPPATLTTLVHGQPIDFAVGVTSGSGTPTGDVSLIAQAGTASSNNTGIGPFTLSGGTVSSSTIMLPGGSYNVIARYAGNGSDGASDSTPVPVIVSTESSKTLASLVTFDSSGDIIPNNGTIVYGSPYFLRFDVTNSGGSLCAPANSSGVQQATSYPCPTGTVTLTPAPANQNGTSTGSFTLNSQGYAEDQPVQANAGQYSFVAKYSGDISYTASTSAALPVTITQATTSTATTGIPSTATAGTQITVTATLTTTSGGIAPTGTMQLLNNGSPLGSPVPVSGTASSSSTFASALAMLTPTLTSGNLSLSAKYSGDINYATSTSAATSLTVTDFGVSANPSPVTISAPGQPGTSTISVTPQNGFAGTVNLSVVGGCPTGAACTLASPSVSVSGTSAVTDVLTITTTGSSSAPPALERRIPPSFRFPVGFLGLLGGMLILAVLLRSPAMRRRPAAFLFAATLLVVGVWAACGGSGGGGGGGGGTTTAPGVGLSPTSLTFSAQSVGTTSTAQSVTLTNSGNANLTISTVTIGGTNAGDFSKTADTCTNATVAASATCSMSVTFAPTAAGSRTASISIADNATGSPQTVSLSGTATSQPTPPGTYPIVINGVSGSDTHSLTVNVTVQ